MKKITKGPTEIDGRKSNGGKRVGAGRPERKEETEPLRLTFSSIEINLLGGRKESRKAIYAWWNQQVLGLKKISS